MYYYIVRLQASRHFFVTAYATVESRHRTFTKALKEKNKLTKTAEKGAQAYSIIRL